VTSDEAIILENVAAWHRATRAGDVESVLRLMAEDAVFLTVGQPPMVGRSTFEKGLRGVLKEHRIESTGEVQELQVEGDLAYCRTFLHVAIIPNSGGTPLVRSGYALSIFRKQSDSTWLLTRDANLLPPPPKS